MAYNSVYIKYYDIFEHPSYGYGFGFCEIDWEWIEYYDYATIILFIIVPSFLMVYIHTKIIIRVKNPEKILRESCSLRSYVVRLRVKHKKAQKSNEKLQKSKSLMVFNENNVDVKIVKNSHSVTNGLLCNLADETKVKYSTEVRVLPKTKNHLKKCIRLLILISFCFVLNNLQTAVSFFYDYFSSGAPETVRILVIQISQVLYYFNSAINCFLYALYSKKFCQCAKAKFPFYAKLLNKLKF